MSLRLLIMGSPKSGKSGSVASAANAGWKIRYLDFDGNPDPLFAFARPECRKNIEVVPCQDDFRMAPVPGRKDGSFDEQMSVAGKPQAWKTMRESLTRWPVDGSNPREWDSTSNVLVLDSLTTIALSKVQLVQYANGREGQKKNFTDYEQTQVSIEKLLMALKGWVSCPVIVMAHMQLVGPNLDSDEDIDDKAVAAALLSEKIKAAQKIPYIWGPVTMGKAQVRTLPLHFNGTVLAETIPQTTDRRLVLASRDGLNLGIPVPSIDGKPVPRELPISTGIASILKAWADSQPAKAPIPAAG